MVATEARPREGGLPASFMWVLTGHSVTGEPGLLFVCALGTPGVLGTLASTLGAHSIKARFPNSRNRKGGETESKGGNGEDTKSEMSPFQTPIVGPVTH